MKTLAWTSPAGKFVSNFETLGAVATKTFTPPSGKRWVILGFMSIEVDVDHTIDIGLYDSADKLLGGITQIAAPGAGKYYFPQQIVGTAESLEFWKMLKGMVLDQGAYVKITWGVAQTTPEVSFPVLEMSI
jgi:hypothetical protein